MTEMTENGVNPDTDVTGREDTEEADSREEPEHGNREHDGEKACPSAGDHTDAESKWAVGDHCRAVWSEDGKEYPATVVSVDGKQCRVRFTGYGNEEDVGLSALKSPTAALQMKNLHSQGWKPGALCWAMYSVDGRFYPAVVLWVKGQRCCVRFDHYNNEEEQDVNCLLNPSEFYGPSIVRVKAKERLGNQSNMGNDTDERKEGQQAAGAEKPANHSFPLFPPFPPPPLQLGSEDPSSFLPPLPPWMFDGKESDGSPCTKTISSLLMLWYMCGFHTGSFMALQMFKSPSKE